MAGSCSQRRCQDAGDFGRRRRRPIRDRVRPDGARFFDRRERTELLEGRFWAELDAGQSGQGAIERDLRENLLGDAVWAALAPTARTFLAAAEQTLRTNRDAPGFDFSGVVVNLAKVCEVQANQVVRILLEEEQ